jgi:hypothetical protein
LLLLDGQDERLHLSEQHDCTIIRLQSLLSDLSGALDRWWRDVETDSAIRSNALKRHAQFSVITIKPIETGLALPAVLAAEFGPVATACAGVPVASGAVRNKARVAGFSELIPTRLVVPRKLQRDGLDRRAHHLHVLVLDHCAAGGLGGSGPGLDRGPRQTPFHAWTGISSRQASRPPMRGTRARASPGACRIVANGRVEATVGDELALAPAAVQNSSPWPMGHGAASPLDEPPGQMAASTMAGPEGEVADEDSCSGDAGVAALRIGGLLRFVKTSNARARCRSFRNATRSSTLDQREHCVDASAMRC